MRAVLFWGLSLALHGWLLWPAGQPPARAPSLAAPVLSLDLAGAAGGGRPPPAPRPRALPAPPSPPPPAPARPPRAQATPAPTAVNHLRGVLWRRLARYFVYPPLARKYGWEGEVRVTVALDAQGRIRDLRLRRSSGHAVLDRNALESLARIRQLPEARPWLAGRGLVFDLPVRYRLRG